MQVISHRGYWKSAAEKNTTTAFARSFALGYGTETDVRDLNGELVISHDMPTQPAMTACGSGGASATGQAYAANASCWNTNASSPSQARRSRGRRRRSTFVKFMACHLQSRPGHRGAVAPRVRTNR